MQMNSSSGTCDSGNSSDSPLVALLSRYTERTSTNGGNLSFARVCARVRSNITVIMFYLICFNNHNIPQSLSLHARNHGRRNRDVVMSPNREWVTNFARPISIPFPVASAVTFLSPRSDSRDY